jgi:hypothetical protein
VLLVDVTEIKISVKKIKHCILILTMKTETHLPREKLDEQLLLCQEINLRKERFIRKNYRFYKSYEKGLIIDF